MERVYIETSAILSVILGQDAPMVTTAAVPEPRFTSALTIAETRRVIARRGATGGVAAREERRAEAIMDLFFADCDVVSLSEEVLLRAGQRFPVEPIRTLDAIHLATIESVGIPPHLVRVITRDRRVRENARAMGYDCPA